MPTFLKALIPTLLIGSIILPCFAAIAAVFLLAVHANLIVFEAGEAAAAIVGLALTVAFFRRAWRTATEEDALVADD